MENMTGNLMDMPLSSDLVQGIVKALIVTRLQQAAEQQDPMYQAKLQAQQQKHTGAGGMDLALILGGETQPKAAAPAYNPSTPLAGASIFMPNGNFVSGTSGPNQTPFDPNAAPIFKGITPETGTPFFTNRPEAIPDWATPESRTAFEEAIAKVAPPAKPKSASTLDADTIQRATQLATLLEKGGVPSDVRKTVLENLFPAMKSAKQITPEQYSKLYRYNSTTGQLEQPTGELSQPEAIKQGYKVLSPKQLETFYAAENLSAPLQDFKQAMERARNVSPWALKMDQMLSSRGMGALSPIKEPGLGVEFQKGLFNITQLFDQMIAGARGAASPQLTQLRQEALPGILNSPELRDKLMASFEGIVENLKRINKAKALGVAPEATDLKAINSFEKQIGDINKSSSNVGSQQPMQARSKSGKPIVSDDGGKTWRYQ